MKNQIRLPLFILLASLLPPMPPTPLCGQSPGGHDVHMTVELGVAEILSKMREQISGTIKFIFQPAEEGAPEGEEGGAPLYGQRGFLLLPETDSGVLLQPGRRE